METSVVDAGKLLSIQMTSFSEPSVRGSKPYSNSSLSNICSSSIDFLLKYSYIQDSFKIVKNRNRRYAIFLLKVKTKTMKMIFHQERSVHTIRLFASGPSNANDKVTCQNATKIILVGIIIVSIVVNHYGQNRSSAMNVVTRRALGIGLVIVAVDNPQNQKEGHHSGIRR